MVDLFSGRRDDAMARVVAASVGLYTAHLFYQHGQRIAVLCVLPFASERAAAHMSCSSPWSPEESMIALHSTLAWVAAMAALLIPLLNRLVGVGFALLAAFWVYTIMPFASSAPHQPFVMLSLLYVAWRDTVRDARIAEGVLRAALATSYAWSGLAKLSTEEWQRGLVFEILSRRGCLRPWLSSHVLIGGLVNRASSFMCVAGLTVECGLPLVEVYSLFMRCGRCACGQAVALAWAASAGMHMMILLLMPLEEVSLGMLLFHLVVLDATLGTVNDGSESGGDTARRLLGSSQLGLASDPTQDEERERRDGRELRRGGSSLCIYSHAICACVVCLTVAGFSIRPLDCFSAAVHRSQRTDSTRPSRPMASLPTGLQMVFPLPASGFETWPCMGSSFPRPEKRYVRSAGWQLTLFEAPIGTSVSVNSAPLGSSGSAQATSPSRLSTRSVRWRSSASCSSALYSRLSGGHTWHHNVARCLRGSSTNRGCRQMLALLLCSCSPLHGATLAKQIRSQLLRVPSNFTVSAIRFRWAAGLEVRHWRCCAGGEVASIGRSSLGRNATARQAPNSQRHPQ